MNAHIMKAVMQSHTDELRRYAKTRRVGEGDAPRPYRRLGWLRLRHQANTRVGRFTVAH
jgi:hypothetical protein